MSVPAMVGGSPVMQGGAPILMTLEAYKACCCDTTPQCEACPGTTPSAWLVTFSNIAQGTGPGVCCPAFNGVTYEVPGFGCNAFLSGLELNCGGTFYQGPRIEIHLVPDFPPPNIWGIELDVQINQGFDATQAIKTIPLPDCVTQLQFDPPWSLFSNRCDLSNMVAIVEPVH